MHVPRDVNEITSYLLNEFPRLNVACRDGRIPLSAWILSMQPVIRGIAAIVDTSDAEGKLKLLQLAGIILASAERHSQALGNPPGRVLLQLPRLEESLIACSTGTRIPALTAEFYWMRNSGHPALSFTGEPHEFFFISAVRTQAALRAVVNNQLRGLLDGGWSLDSAEGARMLRAATSAMHEAHGQYFDFRNGPQRRPLMTPEQFNEMRSWLVPTMIANQEFAGPNAAYIGEMIVTDFLIGTANAAYREYVQKVTKYQSPEERRIVAQDMERQPIVLKLSEALGLGVKELDQATTQEVGERIRLSSPALHWTLRAFKELMDEYVGSSGAHIGLIRVYLEKYAQEISPEQLERMPVKPTRGTGGHSHEHTRQLHDMRRQLPHIRKILTAWRAASSMLAK